MNSETIVYCVVALILGMLLTHMLKSVCGCKVVEGTRSYETQPKTINALRTRRHPLGYYARFDNMIRNDMDGAGAYFQNSDGEQFYAMADGLSYDMSEAGPHGCGYKDGSLGRTQPACDSFVVPGPFAETCSNCRYYAAYSEIDCVECQTGQGSDTVASKIDFSPKKCYKNNNGTLEAYDPITLKINNQERLSCASSCRDISSPCSMP